MGKPLFDFSHLTPERVQLADEWENVAADSSAFLLTVAQSAEIDRRLEAYQRNPGTALPWREALAEIEAG